MYHINGNMINGITGEKNKIDGVLTNGIMSESEQETLTTETTLGKHTSIEAESTYWHKTLEDDTGTYFIKPSTRKNSKDDTVYDELFALGSDKINKNGYWIATRYAHFKDKETYQTQFDAIEWGIFKYTKTYGQGYIGAMYDMYNLNVGTSPYASVYALRPIVNIPIDQIDMSNEYNSTTGWNLK